jgi:four helix bundle suffix protein
MSLFLRFSHARRLHPPSGGYRKLLSYQRAEVVYDATARFCARFLDRRVRTVDQMVQAARAGKQNIIEASVALIKVATCLLDRQSRQLEKAFIEEGGMRERMTRARLDERSRQAAAMSPKSPRGRKA